MPREVLERIHRMEEGTAGRAGLWRLDRNERPDPLPTDVLAALRSLVTSDLLQCYPDPEPLRREMERVFGVAPGMVYATNGSDAAIRMVFDACVSPGDRVVTVAPAYPMPAIYARIREATLLEIPFDENRELDYDRLLREIRDGARLCVLACPDQPTGVLHSDAHLAEIARACSVVGAVFLIDEAYFLFAPSSADQLIAEFKNVVVSRSFSKAYGIAGLRLGALVGDAELVDRITRVRGNHEVNAMAIAVGTWLLQHRDVADQYVTALQRGRSLLIETSERLGFRTVPCPTNFQLVYTAPTCDPVKVMSHLRTAGFLVKAGYSHPSLSGAVRITLGQESTMRAFCDAFETVVATVLAESSRIGVS